MIKWLLRRLRIHTAKSVAEELVAGLRDGTIVLDRRLAYCCRCGRHCFELNGRSRCCDGVVAWK